MANFKAFDTERGGNFHHHWCRFPGQPGSCRQRHHDGVSDEKDYGPDGEEEEGCGIGLPCPKCTSRHLLNPGPPPSKCPWVFPFI